MEKQEDMLPEKKFSTGVVSAAVWKNMGQDGEFKTISFNRRYSDKEGRWKSTSVLRIQDIPKAALVLNKAYEYLVFR